MSLTLCLWYLGQRLSNSHISVPFHGLAKESLETSWGLQRSQPMGQPPSPPLSAFFLVLECVTDVTLHLLVMAVVQGPQPCL